MLAPMLTTRSRTTIVPELPEVETLRRDLLPRVQGTRIDGFWTSGKALRLARPLPVADLRKASVGQTVRDIRRWGKYLIIDTDAPRSVLVHLGMSGRLRLEDQNAKRALHTHVAWRLGDGHELRFVDPRRFGQVGVVVRGKETDEPGLALLGDDPLIPGITPDRLWELTRKRRQPVKLFLMDQRRLAGLGNIYVCEALFRAKLHPGTTTAELKAPQVAALAQSIRDVLEDGLRNRGTTLRDFVDSTGVAGENQDCLQVYGREGERCVCCKRGVIQRVIIAGRSTFHCPTCQKASPARSKA